MTVTAHPLADQLATRWDKLHPFEEDEPMTTTTTKRPGPRDGKSHLDDAASWVQRLHTAEMARRNGGTS